jgi:hypothetical protein
MSYNQIITPYQLPKRTPQHNLKDIDTKSTLETVDTDSSIKKSCKRSNGKIKSFSSEVSRLEHIHSTANNSTNTAKHSASTFAGSCKAQPVSFKEDFGFKNCNMTGSKNIGSGFSPDQEIQQIQGDNQI